MDNYTVYVIFGVVLIYFFVTVFVFIKYYRHQRDVYINKEFLASVFLNVNEAIFYVGKNGKVLFVNEFAMELLQLKREILGSRIDDIIKIKSSFCEEELDFQEIVTYKFETSFKGLIKIQEDIELKQVVIGTVTPFYYLNKTFMGAAMLIRDVTDEMKTEELIYNMTNYDTITGVPNRNYFSDYLNLSIQAAKVENKMLALFIIDLDKFKTVNDMMGHSVGDILLKKVAASIKEQLSPGVQLARLGGDEFTLVMPGIIRISDVVSLARNMISIFRKPWEVDGKEYFVTASMGISVYPHDGSDLELMMKNADTALNNAKDSGRNNYKFYTRTMNATIIERFDAETSLRHAVDKDEFLVYYQPIVDMDTFKIGTVEALIRWNHPINGIVSPLSFIQIAEETGLINEIGDMVLRKACQQHVAWIEKGMPKIVVSVNLSAKQFRQNNLLNMIEKVLSETKMDPEYLQVEITESFAMNNIDYVIYILNELRKMGISIAIDDFGTGYSSINYLKLLPIDTLKIDKSFISDVESSGAQREIVKALISLSHGINVGVTAEGVETPSQLEFLRSYNCDKFQGYFFSQPLCNEKFEELFHKGWNKTVNDLIKRDN